MVAGAVAAAGAAAGTAAMLRRGWPLSPAGTQEARQT